MVALGIPLFLKSNMVNENCVIIDVGINIPMGKAIEIHRFFF